MNNLNDKITKLYETIDILNQIQQILESLHSTTESEFLDIGMKLQVFSKEAKAASNLTMKSAESLSGDTIREVINDLNEILDRIGHYLQFSNGEAVQNTKLLSAVLSIITQLDSNLNAFKKIIKQFKFIGISVRIEAARLNQDSHSFEKLVNDVNKLAIDINDKWGNMQRQTNIIYQTGDKQLIFIDHLKEKQFQQAENILGSLQNDLNFLEKEQANSLQLTKHLSDNAAIIPQKIGEVVASLQFHDIIRQVIEHVQKTLIEQNGLLETAARFMQEGGDSAFNVWNEETGTVLIETCLLQKMHLEDSEKKILNAIDRIVANLRSISIGINEMRNDVQAVIRTADEGSSTMLGTVKQGIMNISESLNGTIETSVNLKKVIQKILIGVSELTDFITDIEEIGTEVELLAQNGLINAAHLGDEGAALSTLADSIQKLSLLTKKNVFEISSKLNHIQKLTDSVTVHPTSEKEQKNAEFIVDETQYTLNKAVRGLEQINSISVDNMEKVENVSTSLKIGIETLIDNIEVNNKFKDGFCKVLDLLKMVFNNFEILGIKGEDANVLDIEHLKKNYTMQSEHDIHNSYMNGNTDTQTILFEDNDNVELF
ncbi:methyl-accepting chemotaxis protein [bacterium]|nr:methyl-accepting chemotaxis protein [bacterium]